MRKHWVDSIRWGLSHVFSPPCIACKHMTIKQPCDQCLANLDLFTPEQFHYDLRRWPRVMQALKPFDLARLQVAGPYEYPLNIWIAKLKFKRQLQFVEPLARVFKRSLRGRENDLPQALIPAPLHYARYLDRQFNQTRELAVSLSNRLSIPVLDKHLSKLHNSAPQSSLNRQQRMNNLNTGFHCSPLPQHISHIAILDDVITTGSTMQAMINAVRLNNPNVVIEAWSIALTLPRVD
ncbi:ComF family protein [Alteromonas facilis]|uniref:ComF family protein n=1 Tax=Alteromonas facilis TaxID=2048004 RepID=UPI000C2925C9|nr:ComF family protein [Alteromonas facilis]